MTPIVVAICLLLASTTDAAGRDPAEPVVIQKSYVIGTPVTVTAGQPVLRVRTFQETSSYRLAYRPRQAMTFMAVTTQYRLDPRVPLEIAGEVYVGQQRYEVAEFGTNAGDRVGFLVGPDGSIHKNYAAFTRSLGWIKLFLSIKSPTPIVLDRVRLEQVTRTPVTPDYELIYRGQDATSMRFEYRERLVDGGDLPPAPEAISVPRSAKTFQVRGMTLAIGAVTPETVTVTVTADGSAAP